MKRFLSMFLIFLVLGMIASSVMATSNVVSKPIPDVPQTFGCPCCSKDDIKNAQVYEIKGPTVYLMVIQILNYNDTRSLLQQLPKMRPLLWDSEAILVNVRGKTYSVIVIPLTSEYTYSKKAVLVYVRYKNVSRISVVEELINGSKIVYTLDDGQTSTIDVQPLTDWGCVATCIASECAGCFVDGLPPGPCDLCCPACVGCYYIRHPYICLACIGCVGGVALYCLWQCR